MSDIHISIALINGHKPQKCKILYLLKMIHQTECSQLTIF